MRSVLGQDGVYLLIVQSLTQEGTGPFTLYLDPTPEPTTAEAIPLGVGEAVSGELAETDAIDDSDDTYYDVWTVEARAGQRLVAVMESEAFDPFLWFGRIDADGEFEVISSNGDAGVGGSTGTRMRVRAPNTGTYELRANAFRVATGPYRLTLLEAPPPPGSATREPVRVDETMYGELSDGDAVVEGDTSYDYWVHQGRGGERLTIRLESDDFDTFLEFGRLDGDAFMEMDSNDDGSDGTNSELMVSLPADGTYAIRARSLNQGEIGEYVLRVTTGG